MTVLARSKLPELHAGYLLAHAAAADERGRSRRAPWLRTAALLAGLIVTGTGLVFGLALVWTQLARALPLTALLHHRRSWRVLLAIGAGLVLVLAPRARRRSA
jgi:hypothetical protein